MILKVLLFNGSPKKHGSTARSLALVAEELEKAGVQTKLIQVGGQPVRGCLDCGCCREHHGECAVKTDLVNECIGLVNEADGIVIGSPVYYGGVNGTMKAFLDRLFFAGADVRHKVGAAVVSLRRSGGLATFQELNNYFALTEMVMVPSVYFNVIHGSWDGDHSQDKEGVDIMKSVGKNMAWLLRVLEQGREIPLPDTANRARTDFIR